MCYATNDEYITVVIILAFHGFLIMIFPLNQIVQVQLATLFKFRSFAGGAIFPFDE